MRYAAATTLLTAILALAACASNTKTLAPEPTSIASTSVTGTTISLGPSAFGQADVSISAGQTVRFVDPAVGGGTHMLCLGSGGKCDDTAQDPSELLSPGLSLTPGVSQSILFIHPGSYSVTCTLHPSM